MDRSSLAVAGVVLFLTLICTTGANSVGTVGACLKSETQFKATCDKDISNVVVLCTDGRTEKFGGLNGYLFEKDVPGCQIEHVCVKCGGNRDPSCPVPGCGECVLPKPCVLPPKVCKNKSREDKCLERKAEGKCTKEDVFNRCQEVCDPRCQLGTPKPKCTNRRSDSFCKSKKHKCHKKHILHKCRKTCTGCTECENRVDDAVCDLVSELGWCNVEKLFKFCRGTCDQCTSFVCLNDKAEGEGADTGCGGATPNCRADAGESGSECFGTVCELNDIDVCIGVDGSGSLTNAEYLTELSFVSNLVNAFANVPGATVRWGGNQFSTGVEDIIPDFTSSGSDFITALEAMDQFIGLTNIGASVNNCKDKLTSSASTSNNKLFILITDGENNRGFSDAQVQAFATTLKMDAQIFTVGAGTDGSTDMFLTDLATDASVFFEADSVTDINDVLQEIITRLCETTET